MRTVDPAKHAARRQHIIAAATRLFATQGFDGTSTAEVCKAAGISSGSLFHYFPRKRQLFAAVVSQGGDETAQQLAAAEDDPDPLHGLLAFVDHLAAPAATPIVPPLVLEAMLQAHRDPELAALLDRNATDEQSGIASLLARGIEAGTIDPSLAVDPTAQWIMALVGAVYLQAAVDDAFDPTTQLPTLRRTLERLLAPSSG